MMTTSTRDNETLFFTSESVGEGHPGKLKNFIRDKICDQGKSLF